MNKRLLALLVAMLMIVVSVGAMAEGGTGDSSYVNMTQIPITKTLQISNKVEDITFQFAVQATGANAANAPKISAIDPIVLQGNATTGSTEIKLPQADGNTQPGVYTYEITETNTGANGVTYDTNKYVLTVTYMRVDGEMICFATMKKNDAGNKVTTASFENKYNATTKTSGGLTVTKEVKGSGADLRDEFTIYVAIPATVGDNTLLAAPMYGDGIAATLGEGQYYVVLTLGNGESDVIYNLPDGWPYAVSEALTNGKAVGNVSQYEYDSALSDNAEGIVKLNVGTTVTVTNTNTLTPDTR